MTKDVVRDDSLQITLSGHLGILRVQAEWARLSAQLDRLEPQTVTIDASGLSYCDSSGIGLILHIQAYQSSRQRMCQIQGLAASYQSLLELLDPGPFEISVAKETAFTRLSEQVGRTTISVCQDLHHQIGFVGEVVTKGARLLIQPRALRWNDTLTLAEKSGADALGITGLLGFLIGLILAFQSAVAMKQFGAEVFVADLVVISLFRELGPLITAFILASRSGSAFAAEIGTMKVNEEIDALVTMGLDPIRLLVLPRILAGVIVLPLLTLLNLLFGLVGCALVMLALGYPMVTFVERIQTASGLGDLFGGLAKTLVFGLLIAGIGCLRGMQTRTGASAVGDAATRAVVSGIVAIILADGVFAVLYYFLGI
ncbi:MAG: MlaE family lipid ABC transporter permease subunit [Phycisphaeraceae bacterium]|nr:MlaE family lipid ABC transporter permease subunit [Phycisphaeraceae bacterium]